MMQGELKLCPLCGRAATEYLKGYSACCSNANCVLHEPMDLNEWQSRPIEDELAKQLDKREIELTKSLSELSRADDKLVHVSEILEKIAVMAVTIVLRDGTVINSGELARDGLEMIRN